MRDDLLVSEVLAKCDALRSVGFWPSEKKLRPRAWLNNFHTEDQGTAALLLDKFNYYNSRLTDALLLSSFHSLGDGLPKSQEFKTPEVLLHALKISAFTPVRGEHPNPTDSGFFLCRLARQVLGINEDRVVDTNSAIEAASNGRAVVFLDDFIGSGDQFIYTWKKYKNNNLSFSEVSAKTKFTAIYIALVATDFGVKNIQRECPEVSLCTAHVLQEKSTIQGIFKSSPETEKRIDVFLERYLTRLTPKEPYIAGNRKYLKFGYKERGLLFGFEHSIPDATLPIFWSPGDNNWEPLIERT